VDPSISVKRKVIVPTGRMAISSIMKTASVRAIPNCASLRCVETSNRFPITDPASALAERRAFVRITK
jgi:hypothetical protein